MSCAVGACEAAAAKYEATPTSLSATIARAKGGDTIVLAPGDYRELFIRGAKFHPALKIDARGAVVVGARIQFAEGILISGGTFKPPSRPGTDGQSKLYGHAINISHASDVEVRNASFRGPGVEAPSPAGPFGDGYGVYARNAERISVVGNRYTGLKTGVVMMEVSDFRVAENLFSGMRSDGLQVAQGWRGVIEDNQCRGTMIRDGEHPDCIQAWSRPSSSPTADLIVRRNRISGRTQGIGFFNHVRNGVDDGGFDRILIEDNDIEIWYPHAIAIGAARDSIVRNNQVRTVPGGRYRASITLRGSILQCGNIVAAAAGKPSLHDAPCTRTPN